MTKLTFGACVKIGFGITLGYRLVDEFSEFLAPVLRKVFSDGLCRLEAYYGKNNTVITKFKEACIYNDKEEDAYKKQPIGFKVTNKHD